MKEANDLVKGEILSKLKRKNLWNHKHTPIERIYKRTKKSRVNVHKRAIKELLREGLLIDHAKNYGAYSLNSRMKREIEYYIRKYEESKNNFTKR